MEAREMQVRGITGGAFISFIIHLFKPWFAKSLVQFLKDALKDGLDARDIYV